MLTKFTDAKRVISKNVTSREIMKYFFCDFDNIISHFFSENFTGIPQDVRKI